MKSWVKLGGSRTRRQSPASCNKAASSGCFSLSASRGFRSDTIPRIFFREAPYPAAPKSCDSPTHNDSASAAEGKQDDAPPCSAPGPDKCDHDSRSIVTCTLGDSDHAVTAATTNHRGNTSHEFHASETPCSHAASGSNRNSANPTSATAPDHAATANTHTEASENVASDNPDPESGSAGRRGATREAASSRRRHGSPDASQICPISSPARVAGARHRHVTPRRAGSGSLNSLSKEFESPPAVVFSALSAHPFSASAGAGAAVAAGRAPVAAGLTRLIHDLYGADDGGDSDGGGNARIHSEGDLYGPAILPVSRGGGSGSGWGGLGGVDDFSPDHHYPPYGTPTFRSGPLTPTASASRCRSPAGYLPVKTASGSSLHDDGGYYPTLAESPLSTRRHLTKSPNSSRHQCMESPQSSRQQFTGSPLSSSRHHLSQSPLSRNVTLDSHEIAQRRSRRTLSQPPDFPGFQQDLGGGSPAGGGGGKRGVSFVGRVSSDSPLRVQTQQAAAYDHDGFASPVSFASPLGGFDSTGGSRRTATTSGSGGGGNGGCGGNGADGCGVSRRSLTQPKTRVPASHTVGPCTSSVTSGSYCAAGGGYAACNYPGGATPGRSHSGGCHLRGSHGSGGGSGHVSGHVSGHGSGGSGGDSKRELRRSGAAATAGARHTRNLSQGSGAYSYAERREESRGGSEGDDFSRDASKLFGCGGSRAATPPRGGPTVLAAGSTSPYHTNRVVSRSGTKGHEGTTGRTIIKTSSNGGSPHASGVDRAATHGSSLVTPHAGVDRVDRVDRVDLFQHYQHNRNPSAWSSPYLATQKSGENPERSATFCGAKKSVEGAADRNRLRDSSAGPRQRPEVCRSPTRNERTPKERVSRDCGAGTQGPRKLGPTYALGGSLGGAFGGSPIAHHRRQHSTSSSGVFTYSFERDSSHHVTYVTSFERHIRSVAEAERMDQLAIMSSG